MEFHFLVSIAMHRTNLSISIDILFIVSIDSCMWIISSSSESCDSIFHLVKKQNAHSQILSCVQSHIECLCLWNYYLIGTHAQRSTSFEWYEFISLIIIHSSFYSSVVVLCRFVVLLLSISQSIIHLDA